MFPSHLMKKRKEKKYISQSRQYFLKLSLHSSLHGNLRLYFTLVRFIILLCGAIKLLFTVSCIVFVLLIYGCALLLLIVVNLPIVVESKM